MALHFRSQNGCDNSTFRGRIDFLNSALSMPKRRHRRAKMAPYLRSWNGSQYQYFLGLICLWMRANLTFFFSKIAPIFSKTAPAKDQNGSVVFYFGPLRELKWPYTRRAESSLRGHRLIGAVLTPKKDLFCGQRFGPNFGVVSALLNLQCGRPIVDRYTVQITVTRLGLTIRWANIHNIVLCTIIDLLLNRLLFFSRRWLFRANVIEWIL